MIIKVYGQFWSRNRVNWSSRKLLGIRKGKRACDIWNQRGIYALYKDFRVVYIGQADSRGIGVRLCEHRMDRFAERWDSFSFFGICEVDRHGAAKAPRPIKVLPSALVRSLELIAILLSDAPLNRARGRFPEAERVRQLEPKAANTPSKYDIGKTLSEMASQVAELQTIWANPKVRRVKAREPRRKARPATS